MVCLLSDVIDKKNVMLWTVTRTPATSTITSTATATSTATDANAAFFLLVCCFCMLYCIVCFSSTTFAFVSLIIGRQLVELRVFLATCH